MQKSINNNPYRQPHSSGQLHWLTRWSLTLTLALTLALALALIADQAGEETAGKVQLGAEYYPTQVRYGNAHLQPQVPAYLRGR